MELTQKNKIHVDSLSYKQLLSFWRSAPIGHVLLQGETGKYWSDRMKELREQPGGQEEHVRASKSIGW